MVDRLIAELDTALRVVAAPARPAKPSPAADLEPADLNDTERAEAAALMRVNHAGEIAAQALYRGQAAVTRDPELREALLEAADDEYDHLAWCADRVHELGSRTSLLAPAWYAGAFAIGAVAGFGGDRQSLGFLVETERQVAEHLEGHLQRLPPTDTRSRRIVEHMREDEIGHGQDAADRGAAALPPLIRRVMRASAKVMTSVAHRI
ncbi:MAG: 2-polyprenyl-3-methyl-6-methoxy-1,4-benzoquinone monooxygenase [Gammaproteobacteria bacterium]|nr:2-polyprenyl-3-methyl-6-methoxy-1,4-benzoquinone monooxygenase [Gammaproteobacteria bacterium]